MGLVENGPPELEPNMIEQSRSKDFAQVRICEHLAPENCQMNYERYGRETMEQNVTETETIEKKLVSVIEFDSSGKISEVGQDQEEISPIKDSEKQDQQLENAIFSLAGSLEGASQNGLNSFVNVDIPPGTVVVNSGGGKLDPLHLDATDNFVHLDNEDRGLYGRSRKRNAKLKGPIISSWSLRSKSQEKPKAPEPADSIKEVSANGEKKKRGRKKKQMPKSIVNEFSRTRTHLRYLLHRINYEQNLIDAYSAEGWRGQSLEKLKPEKQLQQAKSHILRYKLKIRALFQQLDLSLAVGKLPPSLFDSQGEIDSEDIFCAKCGSKDLTLDNDIILCDGACERGFHQFCLEPPLLKDDIPAGDESWLCPGCDCKADCIDMLKDYQGTKISIIDSWEKIFPEAAAAAVSGKKLNDGSGSSSDDSEDEEYDPDKPDTDVKVEGDESSSPESSYFSASDDLSAPPNNEKYLGLPSDDSEDDDFEPSAPYQDEQVKQDDSSSDFTSDSEDLGALLEDEIEDHVQTLASAHSKSPFTGATAKNSKAGRFKRQPLKDELSYLMETSMECLAGKRCVERLDYKKLNDEAYGNSSSDSSDEDFDCEDSTTRKRMKTKREKNAVKSACETPITKSTTHKEDEDQKESIQFPVQTCENDAHGRGDKSSGKISFASTDTKRSAHKRLGEAATQRLYASFNENQYPNRAVKENLAKELGLTEKQVSKWFENARWSFNHRPQMESNLFERQLQPQPNIGTASYHCSPNMELQEASAISAQCHIAEAKGEKQVTNTSRENSGRRQTRKRKGTFDQAMDDATVSNNSQGQKTTNDMQPREPCSSQRRTRSSSVS